MGAVGRARQARLSGAGMGAGKAMRDNGTAVRIKPKTTFSAYTPETHERCVSDHALRGNMSDTNG